MGSSDLLVSARWRESLERSRARRELAGRRRRRRFRVRGSALSLASVALVLAVAGAGVALADQVGVKAGAASAEVTVRKGDRGPAVAAVQRKLRLGADGVFGPMTDRSLRRFQRRKHLEADGVVGPVTRRALRLRTFASSSVRHPHRHGRRTQDAHSQGVSKLPRVLVRIARCESGGNPRAVSPDGRYRGKYQFTRSTWRASGGHGSDPKRAGEGEQDRVALKLYRARGASPWPTCG